MTSRFPTEQERAKRDVLKRLVEVGLVTIQLDSRQQGVDVPPEHLNQMTLVLNLSRKFNQLVFELGPLAVCTSLSFNGSPYTCTIPYDSIYSIVSQSEGKHYLFSESVPTEMAAAWPKMTELDDSEGEDPVDAAEEPVSPDTDPAAIQSLDAMKPDDDPTPTGPPTLRIVK